MYRISIMVAELLKIKQFKNMSIVNFLFAILSIGIQLSIFSLFVEEKRLWQNTVIYTVTALGINQVITVNKVPIYVETMMSGNILKYYSKPIKIFTSVFYEELGCSVSNLVHTIPFFLVSCTLALIFIDIHFLNLFLFIISLFLGIVLSILVCTTVYSITFYTTNHQSIKALLTGVMSFLSGSMLPLILWPDTIQKAVAYTPFALMVDAPIRFLINTYSFSNIKILVYQLLWVIFFYFVCNTMIGFFEKRGRFYGG